MIAGKPNAGKSSLMNALAGHEAAIVTEVAGTTRDVLREAIQLDGMPLNLIDTAGLRESPDRVEQEGIRRAFEEIRKADRLLVVIDSQEAGVNLNDLTDLLPSSQQELDGLDLPVTRVLNKADLSGLSPGPHPNQPDTFVLSAATGQGLLALRDHLGRRRLPGHRAKPLLGPSPSHHRPGTGPGRARQGARPVARPRRRGIARRGPARRPARPGGDHRGLYRRRSARAYLLILLYR